MSTRTVILAVFLALILSVIAFGQVPTTQEAQAAEKTLVLSVTAVAMLSNMLIRSISDLRSYQVAVEEAKKNGAPRPKFDWGLCAVRLIEGAASGFLAGMLGSSVGPAIATG